MDPTDCNSDDEPVVICEDSSSDEDHLLIDEGSPAKKSRLSSDHKEEDSAENIASPRAESPSSMKPIQRIFNRAKPSSHSTQTRYRTRTRSCSLPSRQSRYSNTETPFACDTKLSLLELASKLATADRKVNGRNSIEKKSPGKTAKPQSVVNKTMLAALRKKIQSLNAADEDAEDRSNGPIQVQLPACLISPQSLSNGLGASNNDCIQSPEMLQSNKFQVVKVDLFPQTPEKKINFVGSPAKCGTRTNAFLQDDKLRSHKKNLANAQKRQVMHDQAKQREMECVKQLEEQRAREKQKSKELAIFHAKALEYYNDALRLMDYLISDPDDSYLIPHLPKANGGLPLWPLLASTTTKPCSLASKIENAIREATPERSKRKRPHATEEGEEEFPDSVNVTSGSLDVPEPVSEVAQEALVHSAVNHVLRSKVPKFAKRAFEAARYAAESGVKQILVAEEARREKEARGFVPTPRQSLVNNTSAGKQVVNISPAPLRPILAASNTLVPVPVNLFPLDISKASRTSSPIIPTTVVVSTNNSDSPQQNQMNGGSGPRRFKCPECDYKTDNRSHLRRHVVTVHSDIKPFSCYVCDLEFARGEKCKFHIEREHPNVVYDAKKTRRQNVKLVEDGIQWPLDVTKNEDIPEQSQNEVESHDNSAEKVSIIQLTEHNSNNSASAILKDLVKLSEQAEKQQEKVVVEKQQEKVVAEKRPCPHCVYIGRDNWHLQRHLSEVHAAVRGLKCGICHYTSGRKHRMINHMKKHGELFCFYCDFSTTNVTLFHSHLRICATQWRANLLTCDKCRRVYPNRKQLQLHLSKSHDTEVFFCDMCPYSASDFQEFEQHTETHFSGELDSHCLKCNEVFGKPDELLEHAKDCTGSSSENVKLKCSLCPFNTNQPSVMQEHLTSHTREEIMHCMVDGCKFTARWESSLEQHTKNKHKPPTESQKRTPTPPPPSPIVIAPIAYEPKIQPKPKSMSPAPLQSVSSVKTIVGTPLAMPAMALPIAVTSVPLVSAIPIYANPIALQTASTQITLPQSFQIVPVTNTVSTPKPKAASPSTTSANGAAVYDDISGGIRGHGSGSFICPYCPDRMPFTYRRSYEKHMYKHQKAGTASKVRPNTVVKIKCPISYCRGSFDTNKQVEAHLASAHRITVSGLNVKLEDVKQEKNNGLPGDTRIKNEPEIEILSSDDDDDEIVMEGVDESFELPDMDSDEVNSQDGEGVCDNGEQDKEQSTENGICKIDSDNNDSGESDNEQGSINSDDDEDEENEAQ